MDTFTTVLRYGFLLALAVEALLLGRAFWGLLREKATAPPAAPADQSAALAEE